MSFRVGVVGASGYSGAELLRLLAGHPALEVALATSQSHVGRSVGEVWPALAPYYPALPLTRFEPVGLCGLDLVFLALPHGESHCAIAAITEAVPRVVDLGSDFRLPADVYGAWNETPHAAPGYLAKFSYGLPELFRDDIAGHDLVANPGCYATAAILALAPLLQHGAIEPTGIVINGLSGLSGRGRGLSTESLFVEAAESVTPYGLLNHRHTPEIEQALGRVADGSVQVLFTPHLVPMKRGILVTCTAKAAKPGLSTESLLALYQSSYAGEPFVSVGCQPPSTAWTYGSNRAAITVRYDPRADSVLAIAAIDNLGKGAAGQAIQNANLMLGLAETSGLTHCELAA
ncbi:MAG: N-acetyl-gamma-glutamyl-phosphate reductase [Dehalococcoidia bacterium]